jgi:hypothetical protein
LKIHVKSSVHTYTQYNLVPAVVVSVRSPCVAEAVVASLLLVASPSSEVEFAEISDDDVVVGSVSLDGLVSILAVVELALVSTLEAYSKPQAM